LGVIQRKVVFSDILTWKIMTTENNISIKDDIIVIIKESLKFALVGIVLWLVIGMSLFYLFIKFTEIDMDIGAMLTGIIIAIVIVIIENKKLHTTSKLAECNRRIIRKVLKI
jgi:hypothetical protein